MKTLLVAGGSGGHLTPAVALAENLQAQGPCLILSTERPMDRIFAASSPVEWVTVDLKKFTPLWRWLSPPYLVHQGRALRRIWSVVRQTRPDIVVGFGGYLSAAGIAVAKAAGLPAVIHEQNLLPGRANRWLALLADAVAVSFPETRQHLSGGPKVEVTGNPLRPSFGQVGFKQARGAFGFDLERPVLLVMGGSQGSQAINGLILAMWENQPLEKRNQVQVLHLTGTQEASRTEAAYRRLGLEARVYPFFHEMDLAFAAATLAVSRAGATTITEMIALQVPAILIPYPHAGSHQRANARWIEERSGAVVLEEAPLRGTSLDRNVEEEGLTPQRLWEKVQEILFSPQRIAQMRQALGSCADGSAVDRLGNLVRRLVK